MDGKKYNQINQVIRELIDILDRILNKYLREGVEQYALGVGRDP